MTNSDNTLTMATPVSNDGDELSQLTQSVKEVSLDECERSICADIEHLEKEECIALLEERRRKLLVRRKRHEQTTVVREEACDELERDVDEARARPRRTTGGHSSYRLRHSRNRLCPSLCPNKVLFNPADEPN